MYIFTPEDIGIHVCRSQTIIQVLQGNAGYTNTFLYMFVSFLHVSFWMSDVYNFLLLFAVVIEQAMQIVTK